MPWPGRGRPRKGKGAAGGHRAWALAAVPRHARPRVPSPAPPQLISPARLPDSPSAQPGSPTARSSAHPSSPGDGDPRPPHLSCRAWIWASRCSHVRRKAEQRRGGFWNGPGRLSSRLPVPVSSAGGLSSPRHRPRVRRAPCSGDPATPRPRQPPPLYGSPGRRSLRPGARRAGGRDLSACHGAAAARSSVVAPGRAVRPRGRGLRGPSGQV